MRWNPAKTFGALVLMSFLMHHPEDVVDRFWTYLLVTIGCVLVGMEYREKGTIE